MYPREAIDFEEPYVSPYLRRPLRSLADATRDRLACGGDSPSATDTGRSPGRERMPITDDCPRPGNNSVGPSRDHGVGG